MKHILAVALVLASTAVLAQVERRSFQDSQGRNVGRSETDSHGRNTFYDNMGRSTGRSVTDSHGTTTVYDNTGHQTGHFTTRR